MEKLEIMIKLASDRNIDQVLLEFKEYATEVDVDFVRRAVRAIGRCAIKLERAAERCISVLLELIKIKVNYVVQEAIIVIKDIFRRYPNTYESIIATLCESLDTLDEPEAKASMIWIIGEYAERIDNADELLESFLETFPEEPAQVQLQLLTATVKLFLKKPIEGPQQMIQYDKENTVEAKFKELEQAGFDIKPSNQSICTLKTNTDLLACKAEYYHQCGEYQKCFELTSTLLEKDPFHLKCTLVHLAAAMELGHSNELYLMACNLTKDYPRKALSWFAVGCYYYCIKKYDQSRRYYSKATSLDGTFPPAWIGFGNAYAAQEEGDQAMSAYRTAARLFPGCHLPTLYIGMEYMRTHSFKLAEQFFTQAKAICPSDPLVYNELGVVAYHMKEYKRAVWWFEKTLAHIPSSLSEMWEPTVVNLAHALRKLRRYHEATSYYEKALALSTRSLSTYAGLAYTYHLQDNYTAAITYYHKALWLKPDDQFCTEMLTLALVDESRGGTDPKIESRGSELFTQ